MSEQQHTPSRANKKLKKKEERLPDIPNDRLKALAKQEERRFLCLIYKDLASLKKACQEPVTREWFLHTEFGELFRAAAMHHGQFGTMITQQQFQEKMQGMFSDPKEQAKWNERLFQVMAAKSEPDEFEGLLHNLRGRFLQRQAWGVTSKYTEKILNATADQVELVKGFMSEASRIIVPGGDNYTRVISLEEAAKDAWLEIEDRQKHPEKYKGLPTYFKGVDDNYVFHRGKYAVVMAPEGGGKTTFMLNIAHNQAVNGHNVVYIIIENDTRLTTQRLLCMHANVDFNKVLRGGEHLDKYAMDRLADARDELLVNAASRFHWVQAVQNITPGAVLKYVDTVRSYCDVAAMYVDYLALLAPDDPRPDRPDLELAGISKRIQSYGTVNNVFVMTAQQMQREKVKELQKRFSKSAEFRAGTGDVSGSKMIAGDCDYLFALLIDQEKLDKMYVYNAKARYNASHKRVSLNYNRDTGRLEDSLGADDYEEFAQMIDGTNSAPQQEEKLELPDSTPLPELVPQDEGGEDGVLDMFGSAK